MQIHFRSAENQVRWAWTDGLRTLGQQEITVMVPWPEYDPRDLRITHLLRFLEDYLSSQPKRSLPGQTLPYGWTILRFVADERILRGEGPGVFPIEENQRPFLHNDSSYEPAERQTVALLGLQHCA